MLLKVGPDHSNGATGTIMGDSGRDVVVFTACALGRVSLVGPEAMSFGRVRGSGGKCFADALFLAPTPGTSAGGTGGRS